MQKIDSRIDGVTVYPDRAMVTRKAEVQLEAGESILMFDNLPSTIDENTLQMSGSQGILLKDIKLKIKAIAESDIQAIQSLQAEKKKLESALTDLNSKLQIIEKEIGFIEKIAGKITDASTPSKNTFLDPEQWIKMVDFYRSKNDQLAEQKKDIARQIADVKDKIAYNENQTKQLRHGDDLRRNTVMVTLTAADKMQATLFLSYMIAGASWEPVYDVRVNSETRTLQLTWNALVRQMTSESWDEVALRLSTAQPGIRGEVPVLNPWWISIYRPAPPMPQQHELAKTKKAFAMASRSSISDTFADTDEAEEPLAEPMPSATATVETGISSVTFHIAGRNTVPNNNEPAKAGIAINEFEAEFKYSAVPKKSSYAFLKAKAVNQSDYPCLPGRSNIYLDNSFIARASLPLIASGQEFEASLGIDSGIGIEHKLIKNYTKQEGLVSKKTKRIFEYKLLITNNKKTNEQITVVDQIPISSNAEIVVELITPAYKADNEALKISDQKIIEWHLTLAPGEKKEIPFSFSVEYPKNEMLSGLGL